MKNKLTVFALLASVAGFAAGLMGSNLVTSAYAAGNSIIFVPVSKSANDEITAKCNFDKTIILAMNGFLCVKK